MTLPLILTICVAMAGEPADSKPPAEPCDPTDHYVRHEIEGWGVLVNKRLLSDEKKELREATLKLLGDHLYRVMRVVPAGALEKLRKVAIWVELAHPKHPCMCFHESPDWLRGANMNPEKAGAVELANCETFLKWTNGQPWMVLHELAHAYHFHVLGSGNADIKACYKQAIEKGSYDSVLHISGKKQRAYATNNHKEYFAEASEAFFGANDFYPFVRAELKEHDPAMHAALQKLWQTAEPPKK